MPRGLGEPRRAVEIKGCKTAGDGMKNVKIYIGRGVAHEKCAGQAVAAIKCITSNAGDGFGDRDAGQAAAEECRVTDDGYGQPVDSFGDLARATAGEHYLAVAGREAARRHYAAIPSWPSEPRCAGVVHHLESAASRIKNARSHRWGITNEKRPIQAGASSERSIP